MIIVTGATGNLGTLIVESLLQRIPADQLGLSVRDTAKAESFRERGIRVRAGDFANPEMLAHAFEGASRLLIISSNAAAYGGDPLAQHRAAIAAARFAGVQRIYYTSHMAASPESAFPPMRTHAATEEMLASSGVPWTSLRNGFYADAAPRFMGSEWRHGQIAAPADGKVAWTTHDDLADAAAAILTGHESFDGPTPPLTATGALDLDDLARIATTLLGTPVRREVVEDEVFSQGLLQKGLPAPVARMTLGFFEASRSGAFAMVDPTLERLIQRSPIEMRSTLAALI